MLILAGVSINAIVGDNGILTRTQYASFLNEMAAVEEAVQLWKTGDSINNQGETTAIPTNGMCKSTDVTSTERLAGEVGYYRIWSMIESQPTTNILSSASEFNSVFEKELIFYPAGVQDLYYLNNEACGIDSKKTYLIDAATGMVYSMAGINLKGISCYSSNMAKAVMNGTATAPQFAPAEVSGSGKDEILAGNNEPEYLPDGSKNPNYKEYGFNLYSDVNSNNIYKLYNNGDLYGKGVKSIGLDSSKEELDSIDPYRWSELKIPDSIGEYEKVLIGKNTVFIFTKNKKIFVYGDNNSNKLGLNSELLKEFTGRSAIEFVPKDYLGNIINIKDIYCFDSCIFIVTSENTVYACGKNIAEDSSAGSLGIGSSETSVSSFYPCLGLPQKAIKKIEEDYKREGINNTFVLFEDGTIYVAGGTNYYGEKTTSFKELDITDMVDSKIVDISGDRFSYCLVLTETGKVYKVYNKWQSGVGYLGMRADLISGLPEVEEIHTYANHKPAIIKAKNGDYYFYNYLNPSQNSYTIGLMFDKALDESNNYKLLVKVNDCVNPIIFDGGDTIKQIISSSGSSYFYIMNSGKVWASGTLDGMGLGNDYLLNSESSVMRELTLVFDPRSDNNLFKGIEKSKIVGTKNSIVMYNIDSTGIVPLITDSGKVYITGNQSLMYGDSILVNNWRKIAANCKQIIIGSTDKIGYIDTEDNVYVAVTDLRDLGIESIESTVVSGTNNFHKVKALSETDKIRQIAFGPGSFFALTENGNLYSAGRSIYETVWTQNAQLGFGDGQAVEKLKLLDTGVINLSVEKQNVSGVVYSKNDNTVKCFGLLGYKGIMNTAWNELTSTPTNSTYLNVIEDKSNIKKFVLNRTWSITILEDGNVYMGGLDQKKLSSFSNRAAKKFTWQELGLDGKIVDAVMNVTYSMIMVLTENNTIWGIGTKNMLGKGETSADIQGSFVNLGLKDIDSICNTAQGTIVVDKNGKVYGTGLNTYGIFGRWIGVDRGDANSRYRTAINWVECPELEI